MYTDRLKFFACLISLVGSACSSGTETLTYEDEGTLCLEASQDGQPDPVLHVVFEDCASGCSHVEESACEVTEEDTLYRVQAHAVLETPQSETCPTACVMVKASCVFPAYLDSAKPVQYGEDQFSIGALQDNCP